MNLHWKKNCVCNTQASLRERKQMFAHFFRSLVYFVAAAAAGGWSAIKSIDW